MGAMTHPHESHPVVRALRAEVAAGRGDDAMRFTLAHGKAFAPEPLRPGMRRHKPGKCYAVAGNIALADHGFLYVEGFAADPLGSPPIRHAWLTTTGTNAIDPSTGRAAECSYFGVVFAPRALADLAILRGYHGHLDPVDDTLSRVLAEFPAPV